MMVERLSVGHRLCVLLAVAWCISASHAFVVLAPSGTKATTTRRPHHALLMAKKKKKKGAAAGKGFGKEEPAASVAPAPAPSAAATEPAPTTTTSSSSDAASSSLFLQSVDGGSSSIPQQDDDDGMSAEERAKQLLRDKYGMKTLEEERLNAKQQEQLKAQRKRMAELKAKADAGEDLDLISLIPPPVFQGITTFLQAGIAVTGLVFIVSGLGITLEAWSTTSGDALPENVDAFIVNTIEPNFTTMLLVLLGFSVSLGGLSAAQLGSKSAQYREDD